MAIFDNDGAASCYGRILVNLAMVCAHRLDMPVAAILAHSETWRQMKYTVKTVYGISEYHYCGIERHPLAGTGHDSRASPAVWLTMICLVIISAYSQQLIKKNKMHDMEYKRFWLCTVLSSLTRRFHIIESIMHKIEALTNSLGILDMCNLRPISITSLKAMSSKGLLYWHCHKYLANRWCKHAFAFDHRIISSFLNKKTMHPKPRIKNKGYGWIKNAKRWGNLEINGWFYFVIRLVVIYNSCH